MSAASASTSDRQASISQRHARRTGLVTYCRVAWLDYLCIAIIAALTLGVYFAPMYYFDHRLVPMWPPVMRFNMNKTLSNMIETLSEVRLPSDMTYPMVKEPLPTWGCALVVVFVPLLVVAVFQLKTWSLWDFHAGVVGIFKAVVSTSFVCTILKHFVGGFRPHYIEACKPDWTSVARDLAQGIHHFNATVCQGNKRDVDRALQAFPSGHAASSFAAAIFLALYLNAKLKVFSDYASDFWAFIVTLAPLILASLVSASMYTSHQHQSHDIIFGMIIGLILGMLAYRSAYAAVFDFRCNHVPLPPFATKTQFSRTPHDRGDLTAKIEGQVVEDDELVVWSWWKQSGTKNEEKEKEMAWLRSIGPVRLTGRELGSKAKSII